MVPGWGTDHNGGMDYASQPNLVTDQQRERAISHLQQAYAQGALDEVGFDERLARALTANTRGELNASLRGIARVAGPSSALAPAPVALPVVPDRVQNVGAGLVHLLGIPTGFIGPAIAKALAPQGSRLWWEAGRAMAWQLTSLLAALVVFAGSMVLGLELPIVLGWLAWLAGSAVFAVRAFNGQDSTGALGRALPFRPVLRR